VSEWRGIRSLSSSQEVLIRTLMTDKMPDQLKLGFALWTRDAVRELIRQRCGFSHAGFERLVNTLKRWGYTPAATAASGLSAET